MGEDDDIICQKIISEEIDYKKSKIKALSKEAIDFMKKLLEKNPILIKEFLHHKL